MKVELIAETNVEPTPLSSHAAKKCYTAENPQMGQLIDVNARLFSPGHHTTLQHNYFTFSLEDVPVSACVLGLHLTSPYYNTDQRSGRFSKMYNNPNFDGIRAHLEAFYPNDDLKSVMDFVEKGAQIYADNIEPLTELAKQAIRQERPFANDKYVDSQAPKFAQEQLRMFISLVAPTGLDYTLNLSALTALYRSAWTPELRDLTQKMADAVVQKHPDIAYMFDAEKRLDKDWTPQTLQTTATVKEMPELKLLDVSLNLPISDVQGKDSVDIYHFSPFALNDNVNGIKTEIEVDCGATMGQDQRHRSIRRSEPVMTGAFYLPPLLKQRGLEQTARDYMQSYLDLSQKITPTLAMAIMPYGAMMRYQKQVSLNALKHEQSKRLCWCAQEEIYHLSVLLRQALEKHPTGKQLLPLLAPPCFKGKCIEGPRYCGRQLNKTLVPDYFQKRRV